MLIGGVLIGFISYYLNAYFSGPLLNYSIRAQIKDILPSFFIALVTAAVSFLPVLIYDKIWHGGNWNNAAFFIFPLQLLIGFIVYVTISEQIKTSDYQELKGIVISSTRKIFKK